jgi:methyltransferase
VNLTAFLIAVAIGLLLAETRLSAGNAARLREQGAVLPPGDVYALMRVLYPAAFMCMGAEGLWRAAGASAGPPPAGAPSFVLSGIVLFAASKALKYWAIATLGERWTFRVWVRPGAPLLRTGPYRYIAHPNYLAVMGELAGTAMMMRARVAGPMFVVAFGLVLLARIRFEARVHGEYGNAAAGAVRPPDHHAGTD